MFPGSWPQTYGTENAVVGTLSTNMNYGSCTIENAHHTWVLLFCKPVLIM